MEQRSFFIQNFGCRATQADGAAIAADLSGRGLGEITDHRRADVVVVNTCTVTAEADQDARQLIRRVHRENPAAHILVTGCYAQRAPAQLAGLPGVKWIVGNSHKTVIGDVVAPASGTSTTQSAGLVQIVALPPSRTLAYHGEIARGGTLVGDISRQAGFLAGPVVEAGADRTRPNLKIQDGCGNPCTFCIIPSVRGPSRSADPGQVLDQIRTLAGRYAEVVLTGINLGRWGRDLDGRPRFTDLLRRILAETSVAKLRISSVEPMDWTPDLLELVASSPRIAKHVHIPLQSASDNVLRAMRRRYRVRHYAERVERARALMPAAGIGADVMTGFPGESDEDFQRTREFIERMPFTYLHVFTYSARESTPAAGAPNQVPKAVKKERTGILRALIAGKNLAFRQSLVGMGFSAVTLDRRQQGHTAALTDNYLHVEIEGPPLAPGRLVSAHIVSVDAERTVAAVE